MPVFAAKTEPRRLFVVHIIPTGIFEGDHEGRGRLAKDGFQTRPYDSQFFFAPYAFFAAILFFGCGFAALGPSW
jgi:hypothetical protein